MFNLEVDADHCYRVGEQGILVHNSSPGTPVAGKPGDKPCCETGHDLIPSGKPAGATTAPKPTKCSEVPKCGNQQQDDYLKESAALIYDKVPSWRRASSLAVALVEPLNAKLQDPWTCIVAINLIGRAKGVDAAKPNPTMDLNGENGLPPSNKWKKDHKDSLDVAQTRGFDLVVRAVSGEITYHHSEAQLIDWVREKGYRICVLVNLPLKPCKNLPKNDPEINCEDRIDEYVKGLSGTTCSNAEPFRFVLVNSPAFKAMMKELNQGQ